MMTRAIEFGRSFISYNQPNKKMNSQDLKDFIIGELPTKLSKAIALLTPLSAYGVYKFLPNLPQTWLPSSPEQMFLIRLLLAVGVLFIGRL